MEHRQSATCNRQSPAFTLIEMLVVIGIIAVLASIILPTVGKIRTAAYETNTRAFIEQIDSACQQYYQDFHAYPGPLSNSMLEATTQFPIVFMNGTLASSNINPGTAATGGVISGNGRITGSENLILGLCGGLTTNPATPQFPGRAYDANSIGQGPRYFNPIRPGRATAYLNSTGKALSDGQMIAVNGDTVIPEPLDRFPDGMPILYIRARNGSPGSAEDVVSDGAPATTPGQYNLIEISPYTRSGVGTGFTVKPSAYVGTTAAPHGLQSVDSTKTTKKGSGANYQYPYDLYDYLTDPSSYDRDAGGTPNATDLAKRHARKADTYVLISAGRDRVYGTEDDITNFGNVVP